MTERHIFRPGQKIPVKELDPRGGLVKSWSFSSLSEFETCSWRIKLGKVEGIDTEQHPAAARGNEIHDKAELYIKGELEKLPSELKHFAAKFEILREGYTNNRVTAEDPWAFTFDWEVTEWDHENSWLRMKLDAYVDESSTSAIVIDFKSGRKDGNELKHSAQAQIYAIGAFMRNPALQFIKCEFWYVDHATKNKMIKEYTRDKAMMFLPKWNQRGIAMTSCVEFKPAPSKFNCRWCNFGKEEKCEWRVDS